MGLVRAVDVDLCHFTNTQSVYSTSSDCITEGIGIKETGGHRLRLVRNTSANELILRSQASTLRGAGHGSVSDVTCMRKDGGATHCS